VIGNQGPIGPTGGITLEGMTLPPGFPITLAFVNASGTTGNILAVENYYTFSNPHSGAFLAIARVIASFNTTGGTLEVPMGQDTNFQQGYNAVFYGYVSSIDASFHFNFPVSNYRGEPIVNALINTTTNTTAASIAIYYYATP
jgi:hypothetical protein